MRGAEPGNEARAGERSLGRRLELGSRAWE